MINKMFAAAAVAGRFIYRHTPIAYATLILVLTITFGYDYFRSPDNDWRGHWAGCGNFNALTGATGSGTKNYLSLEIKDRENGQFFVSGELVLTDASYAELMAASAKLHIGLDDLRSPTSFGVGNAPFGLELDNDKLSRRWNNEVVIPIKEHRIYGRGILADFPFDEYRIGYSPVLYMAKLEDEFSHPYALDTAITNVHLSKSLTVRKAKTWADYVKDVKLRPEELTNNFLQTECPLIIERSPWYKCMVALLIVLLFAPAIYLLFRPDDHPGVDLIAVILGVASIRQFLFGNIADWTLYSIDMIFVLVAAMTALIPLINIYRKLRKST